ncbi:MAG: prolyl oligopeptidase family serine peptidase [Candidatus Dadabacteria bacterium]|nr:prolyl oligopeptidase family serine peptidase [Candidatus Dadabacteria bacterium]
MTDYSGIVSKYEGQWAGRPKNVSEGVLFSYYAPGAQSVFISGDMNGWNSDVSRLVKGHDDVWRAIFKLRHGRSYDYKFVVDGNWITDPNNPDLNPDTSGGANSIVYIGGNGEVLHADNPERKKFTLEGRGISHTFFDSARYKRRFNLFYILPPNYDDEIPPPVVICLNNYIKSQDIEKHCRKNGYLGILPAPEIGGDFIRQGKLYIFAELLEFVKQKFRVDESRIYLTGMSNGGLEAFLVSMYYPDVLAASALVFGPYRLRNYKDKVKGMDRNALVRFLEGLDFPHRMLLNLENLPVYISHGGADEAVPTADAVALNEILEKLGGRVKFNYYPNEGHTWMMVDDDLPHVFEWFENFKLEKYPKSVYYTAPFGIFKNRAYWTEFMPYELTKPLKVKAEVNGKKKLKTAAENIKRVILRPSRKLIDTAQNPNVETGNDSASVETDQDKNIITITY